jgi:pSer/pThr/pTyr-binding forkhead associated (FHA) protein
VPMVSDEQKRPDEKKRSKNTHYLNMPEASQTMPQRKPSANTTMLSNAWQLQVRVDDKSLTIPVEDSILVGRIMEEGTNPDNIGLDLSPYGGYHFGVSRRHAIMTLHGGHLYLEDLGSTNGSRINGFQLTPKQKYRLRDGDEIEFARLRTLIRFVRPS